MIKHTTHISTYISSPKIFSGWVEHVIPPPPPPKHLIFKKILLERNKRHGELKDQLPREREHYSCILRVKDWKSETVEPEEGEKKKQSVDSIRVNSELKLGN